MSPLIHSLLQCNITLSKEILSKGYLSEMALQSGNCKAVWLSVEYHFQEVVGRQPQFLHLMGLPISCLGSLQMAVNVPWVSEEEAAIPWMTWAPVVHSTVIFTVLWKSEMKSCQSSRGRKLCSTSWTRQRQQESIATSSPYQSTAVIVTAGKTWVICYTHSLRLAKWEKRNSGC